MKAIAGRSCAQVEMSTGYEKMEFDCNMLLLESKTLQIERILSLRGQLVDSLGNIALQNFFA